MLSNAFVVFVRSRSDVVVAPSSAKDLWPDEAPGAVQPLRDLRALAQRRRGCPFKRERPLACTKHPMPPNHFVIFVRSRSDVVVALQARKTSGLHEAPGAVQPLRDLRALAQRLRGCPFKRERPLA